MKNLWRSPTNTELKNEWKTEYFFESLSGVYTSGCGEKYTKKSEKYRDLIIENIEKFSTIETLDDSYNTDIYNYPTVDELSQKIKHMCKDTKSIETALNDCTGLPYPLFLRTDKEFKILGGRTRTSIAKILGVKIKVMVIDKEKLDTFLKPYWIQDFKNDSEFMGIVFLLPKNYQEKFKDYVLGKIKDFPELPRFKDLKNQVLQESEKLKLKLL